MKSSDPLDEHAFYAPAVHRIAVAASTLALLAVTACGGGDDAGNANEAIDKSDVNPAVVTACNDLKTGNWSSLVTSSSNPDLYDSSLGITPDWHMSTVSDLGNWYATGRGYPKFMSPASTTVQDAEDFAMEEIDLTWPVCAKHVAGFPETVDANVADQVKQGAVASLLANQN